MRFFKYLILLIASLFSISVFAADVYKNALSAITYQTQEAACLATKGMTHATGVINQAEWTGTVCRIQTYYWTSVAITKTTEATKCPAAGMPIATYFANNSPIPTQTCKQNADGTFCIANYGGSSSPNNPLVIGTNAGQQIILNSVSAIPSTSCTPIFSKTKCDSKDPYGGCYQPPDDSCNRLADGSIYCPPDAPQPDITNTCNGATYCKRPPQGCGKGYVSGSFNGQQICIKTNPSTDNPPSPNEGDSGNTGQGTGTGTTTGTSTTTTTTTNADGSTSTSTSTTTTNNTTVNNFKIDLSGVIAAVNAVSAQISIMKNELSTSISNLSSKLDITNSKMDQTNSKLDTTNSKLTDLNASSLKQEQLLKDIRDKTNSDQPASGAETDLSGVTSRLDEIKEGIDKKNTFDKEFSDWMKEPIKESDYAQEMPTNSLEIGDLNTTLYKLTGSCPAPFTFNAPVVNHSFTIDISRFCDVLAIIGILISIAACMHGIAILAENT